MSSLLNKIITNTGIFFLKGISYLPFGLLYLLSDAMFVVVYHLVRYRRNVVEKNLRNSFPERDETWIALTTRDYFRYMCDIFVETLKTRTMTADQLSKRMVIVNPEVLNRFYDEGRSVTVMAVHYGNWEWLAHMPLHIRHRQLFVYKPMSNEPFDQFMNGIRSRFGGETTAMNILLRKLIRASQSGERVMTWLAADQTPPWYHSFWTRFLNQETQFFRGPAQLAKRFGQPVVLQTIHRKARGYYETKFEVLFEHPERVDEETIILTYVAHIEAHILKDPVCYLWSHRRWKHRRPDEHPLHARLHLPDLP